jgi:hypothetical protein
MNFVDTQFITFVPNVDCLERAHSQTKLMAVFWDRALGFYFLLIFIFSLPFVFCALPSACFMHFEAVFVLL